MPEVYTGATALPNWTLYLAVVVGGLAGATYAARRGFDVIGVLALSVTTGLGGLLLRDILLARGPIVLRDNDFIWSAVAGRGHRLLLRRLHRPLRSGAARPRGAGDGATGHRRHRQRACGPGLGALSAIAVGTIVATAGPLLRDILGGDAPQLLRPGVFLGVIALGGSILYVLLEAWTGQPLLSQIIVILAVFATRIVALLWDWETRPADDLSDRVWSVLGASGKSDR